MFVLCMNRILITHSKRGCPWSSTGRRWLKSPRQSRRRPGHIRYPTREIDPSWTPAGTSAFAPQFVTEAMSKPKPPKKPKPRPFRPSY
jgi:hypothetical protein